jgi:signal transduction histidine kinase
LNSNARTAVYRVAQEALSNVSRHANASRVDISIRPHADAVRMIIQDDGRSFDVQKVLHARRRKRLGLLGMRERVEMVGGTFTVESTSGKGTTIQADIPSNPRSGKRVRP